MVRDSFSCWFVLLRLALHIRCTLRTGVAATDLVAGAQCGCEAGRAGKKVCEPRRPSWGMAERLGRVAHLDRGLVLAQVAWQPKLSRSFSAKRCQTQHRRACTRSIVDSELRGISVRQ